MHDFVAAVLADEAKEQNRLLAKILGELHRISTQLKHLNQKNVTTGTLKENTDMPLTPGSTAVFALAVTPADATFVPTDSKFTVVDSTSAGQPSTLFIVTDDSTGLQASVAIDPTASIGTTFTLDWTYTNADGTTATASLTETVVEPVVDVTGGTITEVS